MRAFWELILLVTVLGAGANDTQAQSWLPTGAPTNAWAGIACSADGTRAVAVFGTTTTTAGAIYASTNGGTNWSITGASKGNWVAIASSADGQNLIAAAFGAGIYTSTDAGSSWTSNHIATLPFPTANWNSVAISADGSRLLAAPNGNDYVYYSSNAGALWLTATSHLADLTCLACSAGGTLALGGDSNGHVAVSADGGLTWSTNSTITPTASVLGVSISATGTRYLAAVRNGNVAYSTNGGSTWIRAPLPALTQWWAAASSADGSTLAVADRNGRIYTSANSGATWISNNVPILLWQALAASADGSVLFAASANGGIWVRRSPPAPRLAIAAAPSAALLSWVIPASALTLQQGDETFSNWTDVTNPPGINLSNLQQQLTLPMTTSGSFYRLKLN